MIGLGSTHALAVHRACLRLKFGEIEIILVTCHVCLYHSNHVDLRLTFSFMLATSQAKSPGSCLA